MGLLNLVKDYISENKCIFSLYISVCCFGYFIRVIILSLLFGKLFREEVTKEKFLSIIKQICFTWILLSIIYIIWNRLNYSIVPDFLSYIRTRLIKNYIIMNEIEFNDNNINDDVNNIFELARNMKDVFVWVCEILIPIFVLMIILNLYFLFNYPLIGVINIIGNMVNLIIGLTSYSKLIDSANLRLDKLLHLNSKVNENFNNLFNAYINTKTDDIVSEHKKIELEYYDSFQYQMKEVESFGIKLRYNNYFFSFLTLFFLYKNFSKQDFVNALIIYAFYLTAIENMMDNVLSIVSTIGNSIRIYDKITNNQELRTERTEGLKLENFKGEINFNNISFKYPFDTTNSYIIKNFNLYISSKSKNVIIAQSGSGKTTLMKLLLGFYTIEEGEILLDGISINSIDPISIRTHINYINQKTLLLNDTIMNNIRYGNNKKDTDIIQILNQYDLLKIFNPPLENPESCLQKVVQKDGNNISLGMQKVIYLVRGILRDAEVYVFDEPLTSIDSNTRQNIINMIKNQTENKTLIIITHDMEITSIVDKVIDFDEINKN